MTTTKTKITGALASIMVLFAACGDDDSNADDSAEETATTEAADTPASIAQYRIDHSDGVSNYHLDDFITVDVEIVTIDTGSKTLSTKFYELDGQEVLEEILEAGGFPSSTLTKIGRTRSLDGTQEDTGDGYEASWTYHPDSGLSLIIEPATSSRS